MKFLKGMGLLLVGSVVLTLLDFSMNMEYPNPIAEVAHKICWMAWGGIFINYTWKLNKNEPA